MAILTQLTTILPVTGFSKPGPAAPLSRNGYCRAFISIFCNHVLTLARAVMAPSPNGGIFFEAFLRNSRFRNGVAVH
jgi:hypothetical protein